MIQLFQEHLDALIWLIWEVWGFNLGNGYCKVRVGTFCLEKTPSAVALIPDGITWGDYFNENDLIIEYEGRMYAIGDAAYSLGATVQTARSSSKMLSRDYKLLFLATMASMLSEKVTDYTPRKTVHITPLKSYDPAQEPEIANYLAGVHDVGIVYKGQVVRRVKINIDQNAIKVIPEGQGTMMALTIADNGLTYDDRGYTQQTMGIIQIGTKTTEFIFLNKMKPDKSRSVGVNNLGLINIWQAIQGYAASAPYRIDLNDYQADEAFHNGYFYVFSNKVDLNENGFLSGTIGEYARQIVNVANDRWQEGGRETYFMKLGGGPAKHYLPFIKAALPHIELSPNPIYDECNGAYLAALRMALNEIGILKLYGKK
jgi:hypothetical protein